MSEVVTIGGGRGVAVLAGLKRVKELKDLGDVDRPAADSGGSRICRMSSVSSMG
jgi:hypothetical protein